MYRQGDVLVERVAQIPFTEITNDRLLVRGEGRNHGHFAIGDGVEVIAVPENQKVHKSELITHYLDVKVDISLEHLLIDSSIWTKEHAPITIPPGKYKVIRQREYDPYAKAIRILKD